MVVAPPTLNVDANTEAPPILVVPSMVVAPPTLNVLFNTDAPITLTVLAKLA